MFDEELNRIAEQVGSRQKAFQLVGLYYKLARFYLPLRPEDPEPPVWRVIEGAQHRVQSVAHFHIAVA